MSNRATVKSAFEGLRPSIVREPTRSPIAPQDESKLLQIPQTVSEQSTSSARPDVPQDEPSTQSAPTFSEAPLLTKKRREVLVPVTFRIPQSLKEELNQIAKKHEINQTDLINEGIQLNLQRYR